MLIFWVCKSACSFTIVILLLKWAWCLVLPYDALRNFMTYSAALWLFTPWWVYSSYIHFNRLLLCFFILRWCWDLYVKLTTNWLPRQCGIEWQPSNASVRDSAGYVRRRKRSRRKTLKRNLNHLCLSSPAKCWIAPPLPQCRSHPFCLFMTLLVSLRLSRQIMGSVGAFYQSQKNQRPTNTFTSATPATHRLHVSALWQHSNSC